MGVLTEGMSLAEIVRLSVAPVFLLAGIAGFLNVMSGRLARAVDRHRMLSRHADTLTNRKQKEDNYHELQILARRATYTTWSIGLCTMAALSACLLIVSLFVNGFWHLDFEAVIAGFFVLSLCLIILALLLFLKEVQLAIRTLKKFDDF